MKALAINVAANTSTPRIRELFETADENAPSIIFFDEFDAISPSRENCTSCERSPVNMLLTEMDGLEERGDILMIAATNDPKTSTEPSNAPADSAKPSG